jgi:hypothetical protein
MSDPRSENEQPDDEPALIEAEPPGAEPGDDDDYQDGEDQPENDLDQAYGSEQFHIVTHKLIKHAINELISDNKFDWEVIAPFLESAREMAYADFQEADVRIHTVRGHSDGVYVEAEEAYLGFSVADRDTGEEWLSATYWLSELATEENDPAQVRRIIAAVEKSLAKMREWVAQKEAGDAGEPASPADGPQA